MKITSPWLWRILMILLVATVFVLGILNRFGFIQIPEIPMHLPGH